MNGLEKQRGITFISLVVMLVVVGFLALLALKLGPIYLQNYTIKTVLQNVKNEPFISKQPMAEIRKQIANRLYINEVRRLSRKDIKLKREDGNIVITIDYEVREPILGNVDAIVTFAERTEIPIN